MMTKERAQKLLKLLDGQAKEQRKDFLKILDEQIANGYTSAYTEVLDYALEKEQGIARAKATLEHYLQVELKQPPKRRVRPSGSSSK